MLRYLRNAKTKNCSQDPKEGFLAGAHLVTEPAPRISTKTGRWHQEALFMGHRLDEFAVPAHLPGIGSGPKIPV